MFDKRIGHKDPNWLPRAIWAANQILSQMISSGHLPNEKKGCYLSIVDPNTQHPVLQGCLIGRVPADRSIDYRRFSLEKPLRILDHPDHVTSWQSRDFDKKEYGGGARSPHWAYGCSGLPEKDDELLILALIYYLSEMSEDEVMSAATHSDNANKLEYLLEFVDQMTESPILQVVS